MPVPLHLLLSGTASPESMKKVYTWTHFIGPCLELGRENLVQRRLILLLLLLSWLIFSTAHLWVYTGSITTALILWTFWQLSGFSNERTFYFKFKFQATKQVGILDQVAQFTPSLWVTEVQVFPHLPAIRQAKRVFPILPLHKWDFLGRLLTLLEVKYWIVGTKKYWI